MGLFSFDGGGAGNSTSSTTNNTRNTDSRVVGGEGSANVSQNIDVGTLQSGAVVNLTDHGSVTAALQLAMRGIEGANANAGAQQAASGSLLTGALRMAGEQNQQFTDAVEKIKTSDVRVMIIGGLALVAVVAFKAFGKA
jgi:hypothetical protein